MEQRKILLHALSLATLLDKINRSHFGIIEMGGEVAQMFHLFSRIARSNISIVQHGALEQFQRRTLCCGNFLQLIIFSKTFKLL